MWSDKQHLQNDFCCWCTYCETYMWFFFTVTMLVFFWLVTSRSYPHKHNLHLHFTPRFISVQLYRWFEVRAFQWNQEMALAKAEIQTLIIVFPTLTLTCENFRIIFTGHETIYCMTCNIAWYIDMFVLNFLQYSMWYVLTKDMSLNMLLERLTLLKVCLPFQWWCRVLHHICSRLSEVFNMKHISLTVHVVRGVAPCSWQSVTFCILPSVFSISLISSFIYPVVILFVKKSVLFEKF